MQQLKPIVRLRTIEGQPVTVGNITVTPMARLLTVRTPIGGFAWNRPAAIVVEQEGRVERRPIRDITRILQLAMMSISVLLWIMFIARFFQRKEIHHDR